MMVDPGALSIWAEAHIRDHLKPACEVAAGQITPDNAIAMMREGSGQIWAVLHGGEWIATLLTELAEYMSGKRVCRVLLAGADKVLPIRDGIVPHIPDVMEQIEEFALANDCTSVTMDGSAKLARWCPGYLEIYRSYEKDLRQ